jgi:hypothetical protein
MMDKHEQEIVKEALTMPLRQLKHQLGFAQWCHDNNRQPCPSQAYLERLTAIYKSRTN